MKYTGIGSRLTPAPILAEMTRIGRELACRGLILRSGAAQGADSAFEKGCDQGFGQKEIFLPWYRFHGHDSRYYSPTSFAFKIAEQLIGEQWKWLKQPVKKLHARNVHEVLGIGCDDPVRYVLCWTPEGKTIGGTATAIKLAHSVEVSVINLAAPTAQEELRRELFV